MIKALKELPEGDIKKLKGYKDFYRLRVGNIRIIFEKKDDLNTPHQNVSCLEEGCFLADTKIIFNYQ